MAQQQNSDPIRIKESLIDLPFFNGFPAEELTILTENLTLQRLAMGEFVFREGEQGAFMGFVIQGELEVMKENSKGQLKRLAVIKKGFPFGEMALADSFARSATIMAKDACVLLLLSRDAVEEISKEHPELGVKLWKGICRLLSLNLRRTSGLLTDHMAR